MHSQSFPNAVLPLKLIKCSFRHVFAHYLINIAESLTYLAGPKFLFEILLPFVSRDLLRKLGAGTDLLVFLLFPSFIVLYCINGLLTLSWLYCFFLHAMDCGYGNVGVHR